MKIKKISSAINETTITKKRIFLSLILAVFCCLCPLFGAERNPIDVNLIIDGSSALSGAREEITSWINNRLDQILADGDRVTVWSAGSAARVVYSETINSNADREAVKSSIRGISPSGNNADFSGALRDAAARTTNRQDSGFSYTLLISASADALSSILSSPEAGLLRFSRIEEFSGWRALVIGLNIDAKVRRSTAAFLGS